MARRQAASRECGLIAGARSQVDDTEQWQSLTLRSVKPQWSVFVALLPAECAHAMETRSLEPSSTWWQAATQRMRSVVDGRQAHGIAPLPSLGALKAAAMDLSQQIVMAEPTEADAK